MASATAGLAESAISLLAHLVTSIPGLVLPGVLALAAGLLVLVFADHVMDRTDSEARNSAS